LLALQAPAHKTEQQTLQPQNFRRNFMVGKAHSKLHTRQIKHFVSKNAPIVVAPTPAPASRSSSNYRAQLIQISDFDFDYQTELKKIWQKKLLHKISEVLA
jgi:hypothetical protein